jgi:hypothetical protein
MSTDMQEILGRLAAPFAAEEIEWKPMVVSGNRALAAAYIDARAVMGRLDEVVGPANWQDDYQVLDDGSALCRLQVRLGGEWIQKTDVGGESEQKDVGDRRKASISDALKRAAVKFGIGRYLYRLPTQWVDYDPQKKQFTRPPSLPAWALPGGGKKVTPAREAHRHMPAPATGAELLAKVKDMDAWLTRNRGLAAEQYYREVDAAAEQLGIKGLPESWDSAALAALWARAVAISETYTAKKPPKKAG